MPSLKMNVDRAAVLAAMEKKTVERANAGKNLRLREFYDELIANAINANESGFIGLDDGDNAQLVRTHMSSAATRRGYAVTFGRMGKDRAIPFVLDKLPETAPQETAPEPRKRNKKNAA